jgi:uncharacterized integral membrane protein (TIGR00697 family)
MIYLIGDVLTEVYGYAQARSVLWISIFCRLLAGIIVWLLLLIPPSPVFTHDDAYQLVLSSGLRGSITAIFSMSVGDFCNSYALAKLKLWSKGRHMWLRFVISTVFGEGVNTIIFFVAIFYDKLSLHELLLGIVVGTLAKSGWEFITLPVTLPIVRRLKRVEGVDYYDRKTDFNPFITDAVR